MKIALIGRPYLYIDCFHIMTCRLRYGPVSYIIENKKRLLPCFCKGRRDLIDQTAKLFLQCHPFKPTLQPGKSSLWKPIGIHVDPCKTHLLQSVLILSGQMTSPRRTFLYIHDIEPVNKAEHISVPIIKGPVPVLLIKLFRGGIDCPVGNRFHSIPLCLHNFLPHGIPVNLFTHHILIIILLYYKIIMPIGPVIKLHHIDMVFSQLLHGSVYHIFFCKIADKPIPQGIFRLPAYVKSRLQYKWLFFPIQHRPYPISRKKGVIAACAYLCRLLQPVYLHGTDFGFQPVNHEHHPVIALCLTNIRRFQT